MAVTPFMLFWAHINQQSEAVGARDFNYGEARDMWAGEQPQFKKLFIEQAQTLNEKDRLTRNSHRDHIPGRTIHFESDDI